MATNNSGNVTVVDLEDGRQVCLSYGVIVAAFIPRTYYDGSRVMTDEDSANSRTAKQPAGYLKTDRRFSVTTSKQANAFAGKDAKTIDHETLQALCAPIVGRRA